MLLIACCILAHGVFEQTNTSFAQAPLNPELQESVEVCRRAIDPTRREWNVHHANRRWLTETQRRKLSLGNCLDLLELSFAATPDTQVCFNALNSSGRERNLSYQKSGWLSEATRRRLSVEDCRVQLGLAPATLVLADPSARLDRIRNVMPAGISRGCLASASALLHVDKSRATQYCTCVAQAIAQRMTDNDLKLLENPRRAPTAGVAGNPQGRHADI